MKPWLLAAVGLLLTAAAPTARAQVIPVRLPPHGWADRIVPLGDLPPDARAQLKKATGQDLALGFLYRHAFVFGEAFDLWTWNGQYVLYQGDRYFPLTDEDLQDLLEPDAYAALGKPLAYRIPVGFVVVVALVGAVLVSAYTSAQARARRLFRDARMADALEVYHKNLPPDAPPTPEAHAAARDAALAFLEQTHGVPRPQAERRLHLMLAEINRAHSYDLRHQAVACEMEGRWDEAVALFQQAADLRRDWDPRDHDFLLSCIRRVRAKQARSP